ncbi:hypothetical protein [Novosphingobium mathurense]|nr:hypothetical protein [Novosphingobium mathurense]
MRFAPDHMNGDAGSPYVLYPWQLETLVNEALVLPHIPDRRGRILVTENFSTIHALTKLIQRIEEADDRRFLENNHVLYEVHRLSQRQFEWQRGFTNQPRFYRAVQLFGQGQVGAYFAEQVGCSVPEFIEAAFYIFCGSCNSASGTWSNYGDVGGVSAALIETVLDRISLGPANARAMAKELRGYDEHIGYKPSVLRRHPILRFGMPDVDAIAPLPPLILQRATSGLFFDIVGGEGAIWDEVGSRFEQYCSRYLAAMLDDYDVGSEYRYGTKKRRFDTPDILVSKGETVRLVVECKAKRMPITARFSGDPVSSAASAYEEIAKGVFQVWRYFSHARRGLLPRPAAEDCLGMVLTADPWLIMAQKLHPEVMAIANRIADEKDPDIIATDRPRVPVVLIDELEYLLQNATAETLLARLAMLSNDTSGWEWSLVHGLDDKVSRPYPFSGELRELLPKIYGTPFRR